MGREKNSACIPLDHIRPGLYVEISGSRNVPVWEEPEHEAYGEARVQIREGRFYDYELKPENADKDYLLKDPANIVQPFTNKPYLGRIAPNTHVGTLTIPVYCKDCREPLGTFSVEVHPSKIGSREDSRSDYRRMLGEIADQAVDLLLRAGAPASGNFEVDPDHDAGTLYQQFSFLRAIIGSADFAEAVHRILTSPSTRWKETPECRDVRNVGRLSGRKVRELLRPGRQRELPEGHQLQQHGLRAVRERVMLTRKTDSPDTPENRFVKHALRAFSIFCMEIRSKAAAGAGSDEGSENESQSALERDASHLIAQLEGWLQHSLFAEVSDPSSLQLNSPVLQHKEGYREVFRAWLFFDLAAKLAWQGGDNVYKAGRKDVATLYEYWLFFQILGLCEELFEMDAAKTVKELIQSDARGLGLLLQQGEESSFRGKYTSGTRNLQVRLSYNRSFSGNKQSNDSEDAPNSNAGSWTVGMRPDYTISLWPEGLKEEFAEAEELIVHIHFDAKYKVEFVQRQFDVSVEHTPEDKLNERQGIYKRGDLLKMHAYRDAIRRTGGAYVLYPGNETHEPFRGFHEIVPGLGAFAISPGKSVNGMAELRKFMEEVISHFQNRASQREQMALHAYQVYRQGDGGNYRVEEKLPEAYGNRRALLPHDTWVLVGYVKSKAHEEWIQSEKHYNFRMELVDGARLNFSHTAGASYLLLHGGKDMRPKLWKVSGKGPVIWSRAQMEERGYPNAGRDHYFVFKLEKPEDELRGYEWDVEKLEGYDGSRSKVGVPFVVSLGELMGCGVVS